MFERFETDARTAVAGAQDCARRLGHSFIGSEHLLLALVSGGSPAAAALRNSGVTPTSVEEQLVRLVGLGAAAAPEPALDRDALAALGIDLDQVSAVIDATFGKDALSRAGALAAGRRRPRRRRSRMHPLRHGWRRWHARRGSARRRSRQTVAAPPLPPATGQYCSAVRGRAGHLPFSARAKQVLERSVRECSARHDSSVGAQHLALALLAGQEGIVPRILSALGTSAATLTTAVNDRYRQAG